MLWTASYVSSAKITPIAHTTISTRFEALWTKSRSGSWSVSSWSCCWTVRVSVDTWTSSLGRTSCPCHASSPLRSLKKKFTLILKKKTVGIFKITKPSVQITARKHLHKCSGSGAVLMKTKCSGSGAMFVEKKISFGAGAVSSSRRLRSPGLNHVIFSSSLSCLWRSQQWCEANLNAYRWYTNNVLCSYQLTCQRSLFNSAGKKWIKLLRWLVITFLGQELQTPTFWQILQFRLWLTIWCCHPRKNKN